MDQKFNPHHYPQRNTAATPGFLASVHFQVVWLAKQTVLATHAEKATSFVSRLQGLLGRDSFELGKQALLLEPCNDIHMWGMQFAIDVLFLKPVEETETETSFARLKPQRQAPGARTYRITSMRAALPPWKMLPVRDGSASATLELPAGLLALHPRLQPGELVCIS